MAASEVDAVRQAMEGSQQRIETALIALTETVNRKFDELGQRYVPREELGVTFENIKVHQHGQDDRLTTLEAGREIDRRDLEARFQNAKVVTLSMVAAILTALGLIITHWK